jgi:hypothetical protein
MSRPRRTWLKWLEQQRDRDDAVGSFARTFLDAGPACTRFSTPHSYRRRLIALGADPDKCRDYQQAAREFLASRGSKS